MKYSEIKELTLEELKDRIREEKAAYTKLKFSHSISAIENPLRIKMARRTVAQLNTELTNRVNSTQVEAAQ